MLVEQGVPKSWLSRDASHRWLQLSGDQFEDRRLAGAVAADDGPSLAVGDGEGDVLEELSRAEGDADVGEREKSHGAKNNRRDSDLLPDHRRCGYPERRTTVSKTQETKRDPTPLHPRHRVGGRIIR